MPRSCTSGVARTAAPLDPDATTPRDVLPHAAAAVVDGLDGHDVPATVAAPLATLGLTGRLPHWRALASGVLHPVAA